MDAREAALVVLEHSRPCRSMVRPLLDRQLDLTDQRQRCTDLVLGVLRTRGAIDRIIRAAGACLPNWVQRPLLNIIRLAIYELVYCPAEPQYALVDQAVGLAKRVAHGRAGAFVNAVLRRITGAVVQREAPVSLAAACPRRFLPVAVESGCLFQMDLLPDPQEQPAQYLSVAFSLPAWLAEDWLGRLGWEQAYRCGLASIRRPSVYIQPNPSRATVDQLLAVLAVNGITAEPCGQAIRLAGPGRIDQIPGYAEGLFLVQDPASAVAVSALDLGPGLSILDLCAAPGGKTFQFAARAGPGARIVATDISPKRIGVLRENLVRLGLESVTVACPDELVRLGPFDVILVDAPCSNTGVLARRVEVRYRLRPEHIPRLASSQMELLDMVVGLLGPSGRIAYSTCSLQRQEDQELVRAFLARAVHMRLESEVLTLPQAGRFDHDGSYLAVMAAR